MTYPSNIVYPGPTAYPGALPVPTNDLQDFQIEYNGLLMGPGTNYGLPPVMQFLDLPPIKTMDVARIWADGSDSGPDFADVFTPEATIEITGPDDATFFQAVAAFRAAFAPMSTPMPLWVKLPGFAVQGILAKPNKRVIPIDVTWGQLSIADVQWRATDAVWQSLPQTLVLRASGSVASGLTFPMFTDGVADFGSTSTASAAGVLTNAGNTDSWVTAEVFGPNSGFTLFIDGNAVSYSNPIPLGMSLFVDYASGQATLTGGVDRTLAARQFSPVPAGGTSQAFFSSDGGTVNITYFDRNR